MMGFYTSLQHLLLWLKKKKKKRKSNPILADGIEAPTYVLFGDADPPHGMSQFLSPGMSVGVVKFAVDS